MTPPSLATFPDNLDSTNRLINRSINRVGGCCCRGDVSGSRRLARIVTAAHCSSSSGARPNRFDPMHPFVP